MTVDEALALLDQATALLHAPRADHEKIAEALRTLDAALHPEDG